MKARGLFNYLWPFSGHQQCVKIVRIRSYSAPYFFSFGLNTSEYGRFLRIAGVGSSRTSCVRRVSNFLFFQLLPSVKWNFSALEIILIQKYLLHGTLQNIESHEHCWNKNQAFYASRLWERLGTASIELYIYVKKLTRSGSFKFSAWLFEVWDVFVCILARKSFIFL